MFESIKMKKCKECGKLFLPKSSRSQYCDGDHYRPCPICGEPVLAKYLSDPPRRCDKCKSIRPAAKHIASNRADDISREEEMSVDTNTGEITASSLNSRITAKYVGPSVCGWKTGNVYDIHIKRNLYGYTVVADENRINPDEDVSRVQLPVASFISINQYYKREVLLDG